MAIPMLKIRRPNGRLIFNIEIAICRYYGLYIEMGALQWKGSYSHLKRRMINEIDTKNVQRQNVHVLMKVLFWCVIPDAQGLSDGTALSKTRDIGTRQNSMQSIDKMLPLPLDIDFLHDDVIKWKHFPHYWPFVRGIHWSPVNSPHKGQ